MSGSRGLVSPIKNHPKQLEIWRDPARFKIVAAGRRGGKTILGAEWIMAGSDKPGSINCYVAPTREQGKEIVWDYFKTRCRQMGWGVKVHESLLSLTRSNRSLIQIRSAEVPDRFRGKKYNRLFLDEYADYKTPTIWTQALRPTLSDTRGSAMFALTPKGFNHAYDLIQKAQNEDDWAYFHYRTIDSPFFQTPEGMAELESARRDMSEKEYRQEYEASFESFSGRIYYAFERGRNHTDYEFNPENGPVLVGQDFNRSPMTSCLFQRVGGKLLQFDEVFVKYGNTQATCEEIRRRYPSPQIIVRPDYTGKRKTSNSALSDHEIMAQHGFEIQATLNPRQIDRWAAVNRSFERGDVAINTKKCPYTTKDLEKLCYKEGACEADLSDKMAGHITDAFGYAVIQEFPIVKRAGVRVTYYA